MWTSLLACCLVEKLLKYYSTELAANITSLPEALSLAQNMSHLSALGGLVCRVKYAGNHCVMHPDDFFNFLFDMLWKTV